MFRCQVRQRAPTGGRALPTPPRSGLSIFNSTKAPGVLEVMEVNSVFLLFHHDSLPYLFFSPKISTCAPGRLSLQPCGFWRHGCPHRWTTSLCQAAPRNLAQGVWALGKALGSSPWFERRRHSDARSCTEMLLLPGLGSGSEVGGNVILGRVLGDSSDFVP